MTLRDLADDVLTTIREPYSDEAVEAAVGAFALEAVCSIVEELHGIRRALETIAKNSRR